MKRFFRTLMIAVSVSSIMAVTYCPQGVLAYDSNANLSTDSTDQDRMLRADNIVKRYKYINGKLHYRYYNETTGKWIGDWIPV